MLTVAFTVSCLREKYLRASLESWARARGSADARFAFCLEPPGTFPVRDFTAFAERVFPGGVMVHRNATRLGCLRNTRQAMDVALAASDDGFGVVAEEDLEVADDIIEYLTWARDAYRGQHRVAGVCAHARASDVQDPAAVVRARWFSPLVWATWQGPWETVLRPGWGPCEGNSEGWDRNLQIQAEREGRLFVFPGRSRVIHRGQSSTLTPGQLAEYFYREFLSDCFSPHYEPQQYRELDTVPGTLVV